MLRPGSRPPQFADPLLRWGARAWAIVGLLAVAWVAIRVGTDLGLVIVPLVIALFPAAVLSPLSQWLMRRGMRPALAAGLVLFGFLVLLVGSLAALGTLVAGELDHVFDSLREAYGDIASWLDETWSVTPPDFDELIDQVEQWATADDGLRAGLGSAAATAAEVVSSVLLGVLALFFYLKDGERIAEFFLRLMPTRFRADADEVAERVWFTIGGYFRGQILIAAVDAFFIGLGLVLLGVPLAVPLAGLVFLGGLFPVVGAFIAGGVAVLIALADRGLGIALAVLAVNVVVQQAEGNLLEPLVVGRATKLHPLVVLVALTAGAVTAGILGAFLAVPVAASAVRAVGYFVEKRRDMDVSGSSPPDGIEPDDRTADAADEDVEGGPGEGGAPDAERATS